MQFRKDARFSSNARRISSTVCLHVSPRTSSSNARTRASTSLFATRSPSLLSSLTEPSTTSIFRRPNARSSFSSSLMNRTNDRHMPIVSTSDTRRRSEIRKHCSYTCCRKRSNPAAKASIVAYCGSSSSKRVTSGAITSVDR